MSINPHVKEWLEEIETDTLEDMKESFGVDVALDFDVTKFGEVKDLLRDEEYDSGSERIIQLEFYFVKDERINEEYLKEYVDKIYRAWFHKERCGCSHDCCGCTFTANYSIMKRGKYDYGEADMHEFIIIQSNGINY